MADLRIAKTLLESAVQGNAREGLAKGRPSKFDQIRSRLTEEVASRLNMPPLATVSHQQRISLESALRQRLAATEAGHPDPIVAADATRIRQSLENLRHVVEKLPSESTFNPVRARLSLLEKQFQQSAGMIQRVKGADPQSLLKLQVQMYQLTQNIELLSKVVEQVSSGVKTVLQTQVG
jgi:hypothetical protein